MGSRLENGNDAAAEALRAGAEEVPAHWMARAWRRRSSPGVSERVRVRFVEQPALSAGGRGKSVYIYIYKFI